MLTVLPNLLGKSLILLEAEDDFCQAFPVSIIHLLLFLLFYEQRGFGGTVKIFQGSQNLFFMSFMAFRENCYGGTVRFSGTQILKNFWKPRGKTEIAHEEKKNTNDS